MKTAIELAKVIAILLVSAALAYALFVTAIVIVIACSSFSMLSGGL